MARNASSTARKSANTKKNPDNHGGGGKSGIQLPEGVELPEGRTSTDFEFDTERFSITPPVANAPNAYAMIGIAVSIRCYADKREVSRQRLQRPVPRPIQDITLDLAIHPESDSIEIEIITTANPAHRAAHKALRTRVNYPISESPRFQIDETPMILPAPAGARFENQTEENADTEPTKRKPITIGDKIIVETTSSDGKRRALDNCVVIDVKPSQNGAVIVYESPTGTDFEASYNDVRHA